MNNLFLVFIAILVFALLLKPDEKYNPTQQEIQDLSYTDKTQYIQDYPYPQISRTFKQLGKGQLPSPFNNESEILPSGGKDLRITRTRQTAETMNTKRVYLPDFYRKDRMGQNPSGTEELRSFINDKNKSEQSWTDENVSEHPKFYNADIKDELTNIGAFFDKNNQYNDITSSNTESLSSDKCYTDKSGNYFCSDNTRLQLIPPKLITDPKSCYALNNVGIFKDNNSRNDMNDKVINGGIFFDNIKAAVNNTILSNYDNGPLEITIDY